MIAVGIDLVEITRFEKLVESDDFLRRCFCKNEIEYYIKCKRVTYLAGRFAVKEAVVKALGSGLIDGASFTDIQTTRTDTGIPGIILKNKILELASELRIKKWLISITHAQNYASAIAIAE